MAKRSSNLKGFYKQKKSRISKKPSKTLSKNSPAHAASVDDEYDKEDLLLRQFDMNMAYGPCIGMTRMERFERARRLGLNPPQEIDALIRQSKARLDCLWDGRV